MKQTIVKILQGLSIIFALFAGVFVAKNIDIEMLLRSKEEPVTLAETENGMVEDYIGYPAAADIPRIETVQAWEDAWQTSCFTIEPIGIIPTGIGERHPWISMYTSQFSRLGGSRKREDVTRIALDFLGEYAEYYLLQLPDQSYILAQMPVSVAAQIKAGKKITLPIGKKGAVHVRALANMEELCEQYHVYTKGVFYCINDQWNEAHSGWIQFICILIIFVVLFAVGIPLFIVIDKVFKVKD